MTITLDIEERTLLYRAVDLMIETIGIHYGEDARAREQIVKLVRLRARLLREENERKGSGDPTPPSM